MSTKEHQTRSGRASHRAAPGGTAADQVTELNRMLEAGQHALHTWQTIGDELCQLGRRNLEIGIETANAMNGRADPSRALELQMSFWRGAAENYTQTAQACMTLAARSMSDGYACLASAPRTVFGACQGWINPTPSTDNTDKPHTAA